METAHTPYRDQLFDVIIVGAGPAGCVLASRLSEEPDRKILLVEAGPDAMIPGSEHPDVLDPFALIAGRNPAFHWPGLIAQTGVARDNGAVRASGPYVQGFGVGGASNINGMGVDRGQPGDFDEWRDLGAVGWGWTDVLPFFKKLEHDLDSPDSAGRGMHGHDGPMPVRRSPRSSWPPFTAALGAALERRGFPFLDDYTVDFRDGFAPAPTNCSAGRRISAPTAYLTRDVRRRPNLQLLADTRVDRVSLDGLHASGVFVINNDTTRQLRGREVILSCGAIQSPAVLMRSGLGPSQKLTSLGIEVVKDLSGVGANLQNHPCVALTTFLSSKAAQPRDNLSFLQSWLRYSSHHPRCDLNDMHLMPFNKCDWHSLGRQVGTVVVSVLKSYSKGKVELRSSSPTAEPQVQFNLLDDSRDENRLVAGLRFALQLLIDPAVAQKHHQLFVPNGALVASLSRRNLWNAAKGRAIALLLNIALLRAGFLAKSRIHPTRLLADDAALRQFVREHVQLQYHPCGTCRMGRSEDNDAVIDSGGRVHGIGGLRVADASIFPTIPRGYPHFIVLMAAEKIADDIRSDWSIRASRMRSELAPASR